MLPLLTPEALHFFLPAFLLYALDNWQSEVWHFTVYSLAPGKEKEDDLAWWQRRFSLFTPEQKEVLFAFLDQVIADPEAYHQHTVAQRGKKRLGKYLN